ncbi:MAG: hypothetical protein ABIR80_08645, partial [Opitutaceae bacterium]
MTRPPRLLWRILRACGSGVLTLGVWSLWLALALLFILQIYVVTTREVAVPSFLLRGFERRMAEAGLHVEFSRTSFDPTGRLLVENTRFSLPGYGEPVVTARAVYLTLNPWMLALGQFDPQELRLTGTSVAVPAMFSPSGRAEEIV